MNNALFQICAAAVLTAIIKALMPDGRSSNQIRILISGFFLLTAVSAFKDNIILSDLISFDEIQYNDYSVSVNRQTVSEFASSLRSRISDELKKENIFPEKIYIDVNNPNNSGISISEIKLVFRKDEDNILERAVELTKQYTGEQTLVTAEVIYK